MRCSGRGTSFGGCRETDYSWRVIHGEAVSDWSRFSTADGMRLLAVDGVPNFRDLGGYVTKDGRRVRQKLLFRCSKEVRDLSDPYSLRLHRYDVSAAVRDSGLQLDRLEGQGHSLHATVRTRIRPQGGRVPSDVAQGMKGISK